MSDTMSTVLSVCTQVVRGIETFTAVCSCPYVKLPVFLFTVDGTTSKEDTCVTESS